MRTEEIDALYASAEAEVNQAEEVMLISPFAVIDLIDLLRRCERKRAATIGYDELHDA